MEITAEEEKEVQQMARKIACDLVDYLPDEVNSKNINLRLVAISAGYGVFLCEMANTALNMHDKELYFDSWVNIMRETFLGGSAKEGKH